MSVESGFLLHVPCLVYGSRAPDAPHLVEAALPW